MWASGSPACPALDLIAIVDPIKGGPDAIGFFTGRGLKSPASDLMHNNPQWQGRGGPPLGPVALGSS